MKRGLLIAMLVLSMAASVAAEQPQIDRVAVLPPGLSNLDLTVEQQQQVQRIMEERRVQRQAMRFISPKITVNNL